MSYTTDYIKDNFIKKNGKHFLSEWKILNHKNNITGSKYDFCLSLLYYGYFNKSFLSIIYNILVGNIKFYQGWCGQRYSKLVIDIKGQDYITPFLEFTEDDVLTGIVPFEITYTHNRFSAIMKIIKGIVGTDLFYLLLGLIVLVITAIVA